MERWRGKSSQIWRVAYGFWCSCVVVFRLKEVEMRVFIKDEVVICLIGFNGNIVVKEYLRDVLDMSGMRTQGPGIRWEHLCVCWPGADAIHSRGFCKDSATLLHYPPKENVTTNWRWPTRTRHSNVDNLPKSKKDKCYQIVLQLYSNITLRYQLNVGLPIR